MSPNTPPPPPPIAPARPKEIRTHDDLRVDDYYWLRERDNPEVIAYLKAENAYTKAMTAHNEASREQLFAEMKSRIQETDESVPVQIDDYFYYRRTEKDQQYAIYCRKRGSLDAPEERLLDLNAEAEGKQYMRLGNFAVSPDHRLLAYALDDNGSETYTLLVKDLHTRTLRPDTIPNTYYGLTWANDNNTLFYTTLDAAKRPEKLLRHRLGTDPAADAVVFHEPDEFYFLGVRKSRTRRYIFIHLRSAVTTEVHALDADAPDAPPRRIQLRIHGMEYSVDHHQDARGSERFFIVTNWEAENFRVMETPVDAPGRENWREFIPHREVVKVRGEHRSRFQQQPGESARTGLCLRHRPHSGRG